MKNVNIFPNPFQRVQSYEEEKKFHSNFTRRKVEAVSIDEERRRREGELLFPTHQPLHDTMKFNLYVYSFHNISLYSFCKASRIKYLKQSVVMCC